MSRVAYVNGRYFPWSQAQVSIEDRGYQFADGVYEVCQVLGGCLVDWPRHLDRLHRSLDGLRIAAPLADAALQGIVREVLRRNRVSDGIVYLQVTRGVGRREHAFPPASVRPSLVVTARNLDQSRITANAERGVSVITVPETRWARVDIKAIALLPNVLARQAAREQGAAEAWFVTEGGLVTEGSASNAWIVTADGRIVTTPSSPAILTGITRAGVLETAAALQMTVEERSFTVEEALAAREAFMTAASLTVMPVVRIDGRPVGDGSPGPVARRLRAEFHRFADFC
jgi:D-alanine transaminase